jgi:uncharacterized protein (DUF488 family)
MVTKTGSRSVWNGRLYTFVTLGSESDYTPTACVLFNSAQLIQKYIEYLGCCDSNMGLMNRTGNLAAKIAVRKYLCDKRLMFKARCSF